VKLYVNPMSSNARRALIVAKLTGLPVEIQVVDLAKGEHRAPAYLGLNPNHKVPTLVDGDLHLWESGAICQYLAAKAGRTDLWPTEPAAQADVSRWMLWNHTQWAPPIGAFNFERLFKKMFGMGEGDEAVALAKLKEWGTEAATLDAHLATREWVAQGHLTLADIQLAGTLTYAQLTRMPLGDYPNLSRWFERVKALPAWKETELPG
jgi:glutathione S-transferase